MSNEAFHQLVPERSDVVPTVSVEEVWDYARDTIAASPAAGQVVMRLTGRELDQQLDLYLRQTGIQSAADAFLNDCVASGALAVRIDGRSRFYRLPPAAFSSGPTEGNSPFRATSATWSSGRLSRIDTSDEFWWIVDAGFLLLTTSSEASAAKLHIDQIVREAEVASEADEEPNQEPGPESLRREREAWAVELMAKAFWNLTEVIYWIARRDAVRVAECVDPHIHGADWFSREISMVEIVAALAVNSAYGPPVEPEPEKALMRALENETLKATGLEAGKHERASIEATFWIDHSLESARKLRFQRADVLKVFEPVPTAPEVANQSAAQTEGPDSDHAVDATIRQLMADRGGRLPQNEGATELRKRHPTRLRDELRKRIKALTGNAKPGPTGPRLNRANNRA